jgi:U4/U6 small nuclear ribonucleoprotein PRP31
MKAQRKVGAKVALAARVDIAKSSPTGAFGEEMKGKLEAEMERLARPPPKKATKALPRPDEKKKARRGGKRCVTLFPLVSPLSLTISFAFAGLARRRRRTQ